MKPQHFAHTRQGLRRWFFALAATAWGCSVAVATPYATCLTNNAGTVSFRVNEHGAAVKVIGNGGTLTNDLGPVPRGLTVTNLTASGMTGGVFRVVVSHIGVGFIQTNSAPVAFNSPRGVTVNKNPASEFFGRVYVANSTNGIKGDGIFVFDTDLNDTFAQGSTPRTGGLVFTGVTDSSRSYYSEIGSNNCI